MEYGNLAYKLEPEVEAGKVKKKAAVPKQKLNVRAIFFAFLIAFAAYFMISKQVAVFETEKEISRLENQLKAMKSTEVQMNFELEQAVDLATVEEIATTKLNMQRSEHNQKVYVDITSEDVTEFTAKDTEGMQKKVRDFTGDLKKNIAGIFSLS